MVRARRSSPLRGRYLFGDFCDGRLSSADLGRGTWQRLGIVLPYVSSFGADARGRVYATTLTGHLHRLVATAG